MYPSIFKKAYNFKEAEVAKKKGLYPFFKPIQATSSTKVVIDNREVIMAGSNNYMGLVNDPRLKKAAEAAIEKFGTGCTGSRYLNGTLDMHLQLEKKIAEFMNKEACVLFSTGYQTNEGVLQSMVGREDIIFSDKENHACIVTGTNLSLGKTVRYTHDDMEHLERMIKRENENENKLIVSDGVFSMSGKIANVPDLVAIKKKYNAALMLDDAHAIAVIGKGGRGSASHYGLLDDVDMITGTFSKSFASLGGFVVGPKPVIEYIRHKSIPHIFSASVPPANIATVLTALDIIKKETWRMEKLQGIAKYMYDEFKKMGFNVLTSQTPIISIVIGQQDECFAFWKALFEKGIYVNAVIPPAVPEGYALIRTSYMATHSEEELNQILNTFRTVGLSHGVIQ